MALFAPVQRSQQSQNLVEFRAGKMTLSTSNNMCTPDKRKGLVYLQASSDGLVHFCWKDRDSGALEDDLIIFPEDAVFKRVEECTTGRVFLLKMKATSKKLFFWMQDPKTEKDAEILKKVNDILNHGPSAVSSGSGSGSSSRGRGLTTADLAMMLGNSGIGQPGEELTQDQMEELNSSLAALGGSGLGGNEDYLQMLSGLIGGARGGSGAGAGLGGGGTGAGGSAITHTPSNPTAVDTALRRGSADGQASGAQGGSAAGARPSGASGGTDAAGPHRVQLADLQSILSGMNIPESGEAATPREGKVVENVGTGEALDSLLPHLPEDESLTRDRAEAVNSIRSPQFSEAVQGFSYGLQTGQLGYVLKSMGISDRTVGAASRGDMHSFAEMLQQDEKGPSSSDQKKDEGGGQGNALQ